MLEAAKIWNEPNNKSHWDPEIDPDWSMYGTTVIEAAKAIRSVNPDVKRATEDLYQLVDKGYIMPGTAGLTHTESQSSLGNMTPAARTSRRFTRQGADQCRGALFDPML